MADPHHPKTAKHPQYAQMNACVVDAQHNHPDARIGISPGMSAANPASHGLSQQPYFHVDVNAVKKSDHGQSMGTLTVDESGKAHVETSGDRNDNFVARIGNSPQQNQAATIATEIQACTVNPPVSAKASAADGTTKVAQQKPRTARGPTT